MINNEHVYHMVKHWKSILRFLINEYTINFQQLSTLVALKNYRNVKCNTCHEKLKVFVIPFICKWPKLECNIFSNFSCMEYVLFLYCFSPYFVNSIWSVFFQSWYMILIFHPKMITVIGWIITGISWGIVLVTMPFSLCVCFKVSHSPNIKFSPIFGNS